MIFEGGTGIDCEPEIMKRYFGLRGYRATSCGLKVHSSLYLAFLRSSGSATGAIFLFLRMASFLGEILGLKVKFSSSWLHALGDKSFDPREASLFMKNGLNS